MPAPNVFTPLLNGEIGNWRRVGHSTTNWFSSIDRTSFGFKNVVNQSVNTISNFGGVAGGVGGSIAIGLSAGAAGAVAGAGFLAAVAGPQVAVTAAVIGLAMIAKGTYSNRESAHKKLSEYVWNLVDDMPPSKGVTLTKDELIKAADAATTLLDDGKNQIKLLGSKMEAAQKKFAVVNTAMIALGAQLNDIQLSMVQARATGNATAAALAQTTATAQADAIKARAKALWDKESKPGGGIFEYVRRCSHTGNYLQAPHLIALCMKETHSPGSVSTQAQVDYFLGSELARKSREAFASLDTLYTKLS